MSNRYQREIEEILKQAGDLGPSGRERRPKQSFRRLLWIYVSQSLGGRGWSVSPGRIMLIAGSLLLSALIFRAMVPGLQGLGAPLAWAGLLLFIVGYAMIFVRPAKIEKRWRGQPLEDAGESWWDRIRRRRG